MSLFKRPSAFRLLRKTHADGFLITSLSNIRYLTGLSVSVGFLLAKRSGYMLFLDSRYLESARRTIRSDMRVLPLDSLPSAFDGMKRVAFESEDVTVANLRRWKKKYGKTAFVGTSRVVEEFRRTKLDDELANIRRACSITKSVLRILPKLLVVGISERNLAWRLESECRRRGAEGMAFESIVAFGENSSRPHHHPTDRKLVKGDLVQIDMGAKFHGYCSDYSRVFFTSKASREQAKALRALKHASAAAVRILKPGVTNRDLDLEARSVLKTFGYDKEFSHALGHGVGIDIHEGVTLSSRAFLQKIKKNEVITIEPGLYFEGKWGMRIEETIVVKNSKK